MRNQNTKKLVISALLLGIGAILHQVTPTLGLPMQADFALIMLFMVIILNGGEYKTCLIAGVVTAIFTALTTKFPAGQLPNCIDKIITVNVVYLIILLINKFKFILKLSEYKRKFIQAIIILPIGTFISGTIFLGSASIMVGLPAPFLILFTTVVLPAVIINLIVGIMLFKIIESALKKI